MIVKFLTIGGENIIIKILEIFKEVEFMKGTYQPNNRKKAKKHGFFARKESNVLKSRRKKGRKVLAR